MKLGRKISIQGKTAAPKQSGMRSSTKWFALITKRSGETNKKLTKRVARNSDSKEERHVARLTESRALATQQSGLAAPRDSAWCTLRAGLFSAVNSRERFAGKNARRETPLSEDAGQQLG
ncbi:hypothetical protein TRVL_07773 [Trypanosoma vivax]|nr:hypothetical protein TRVL_07773 [Trypanosoma vivax]